MLAAKIFTRNTWNASDLLSGGVVGAGTPSEGCLRSIKQIYAALWIRLDRQQRD
jgi:hypothetical protein